jgi:uncharacterized protein (DUF488 family)
MLTIGHSTHAQNRFAELLRAHGIEVLVDVRRYPASRRHPQFNADSLKAALQGDGVAYLSLGHELGGRRRPRPDSPNTGWRVAAFGAYADHMHSAEFVAGLKRLEDRAQKGRAAIMCAEGDWRRCHRRLIADALVVRGWRVLHIRPDGGGEEHQLTPFAVTTEAGVVYPVSGQAPLDISD